MSEKVGLPAVLRCGGRSGNAVAVTATGDTSFCLQQTLTVAPRCPASTNGVLLHYSQVGPEFTPAMPLLDVSDGTFTAAAWSPRIGRQCFPCICGGRARKALVLAAPPKPQFSMCYQPLCDVTGVILKNVKDRLFGPIAPELDFADLAADICKFLDCDMKGTPNVAVARPRTFREAASQTESLGYMPKNKLLDEKTRVINKVVAVCAAWSDVFDGKCMLAVAAKESVAVLAVDVSRPFDVREESFALCAFVEPDVKAFVSCVCFVGKDLLVGFSNGQVDMYRCQANMDYTKERTVLQPCRRGVTVMKVIEVVIGKRFVVVARQSFIDILKVGDGLVDHERKTDFADGAIVGVDYSFVYQHLFVCTNLGTVRCYEYNDMDESFPARPFLAPDPKLALGCACSPCGMFLTILYSDGPSKNKNDRVGKKYGTTSPNTFNLLSEFIDAGPAHQLFFETFHKVRHLYKQGKSVIDYVEAFCSLLSAVHTVEFVRACLENIPSDFDFDDLLLLKRLMFCATVSCRDPLQLTDVQRSLKKDIEAMFSLKFLELVAQQPEKTPAECFAATLHYERIKHLEVDPAIVSTIPMSFLDQSCLICSTPLMHDPEKSEYVCTNNHTWQQCSLTLLSRGCVPLTASVLKCPTCSAFAMDPYNEHSFAWLRPDCPYCTTPFSQSA